MLQETVGVEEVVLGLVVVYVSATCDGIHSLGTECGCCWCLNLSLCTEHVDNTLLSLMNLGGGNHYTTTGVAEFAATL